MFYESLTLCFYMDYSCFIFLFVVLWFTKKAIDNAVVVENFLKLWLLRSSPRNADYLGLG